MFEKIQGTQRPLSPQTNGGKPAQTGTNDAADFADVLRNERIRFSQHAQERLQERKLALSPGDVEKIANAVDKAATKGARESLLLLDNMALVVSIKNRTVITAVDQGKLKENVFTNIDSAIIV